jgi:hypothetical protein
VIKVEPRGCSWPSANVGKPTNLAATECCACAKERHVSSRVVRRNVIRSARVEICREFRHLAHHTENVQVPLPLGAGGKSWTFVITVIQDRPISFDLGVQSYQLRGLVAFVVALLNPRLNATPISHAALRCASSSPRVINEMSVRQGVLP